MIRYLRSQSLLAIFLLPFLTASVVSGDEVVLGEFSQNALPWKAMHHVDLSVVAGELHVQSTGNDPHFMAPVTAAAGWYQLVLRAKFQGNADFQLFWTTQQDSGTAEQRSVRDELSGDENQFRTFKVRFRTDSPLTSLRLDPFGRPGRMVIESLVLTAAVPKPPMATPVTDIKVPDGFQVELLHSVDAAEHGSWVSMTSDAQGRLIVSDQYGGLHRVTPPPPGSDEALRIETINLEIGMAQGLLYAFDSLYVMVNGQDPAGQGLYRVRDTDGDDQFDKVEFLRKLDGGGEHGPHAIIAAPDGKSLYVCAGNHTDPPAFEKSRVPRNWGEDQLLPRMWDAGGHAVGRMAPGGWIAKVSPDGQEWELMASGFRNEYDIAFSPEGELFTYDADMEWDVGTPWYRPTRVNHVISGAEFGWRSGTGKWPTWYPDSLPSAVDIGQGSPTGIVFGAGAKFPEKYQRALFISDWSYGVIYAVHLTPDGATWKAEAERFIAAAPLPATDLVIGSDGAFYFTIGGRKTQSGLYRVTYTGRESTAAASSPNTTNAELRSIRQNLEALHQPGAADAVEKAWPYLGHPDRYIRYAARIAIEQQPASEWSDRALAERTNADAGLTALLALARQGDPSLQHDLLRALALVSGTAVTEQQHLAALRVLALTFIRMGEPENAVVTPVTAILSPLYPTDSAALNRELCAMLVYLGDDTVAEKTLRLMQTAQTQEEQMYYALCLRALKQNWPVEVQREYFRWFLTATGMRGGNSFSGFLKNIRQEAIDVLPDERRAALADVLAMQPVSVEPVIESTSRPFVRDWNVDDLLADVETGLTGRNFENGRRMFTITGCFKCHRFAGRGGIVGPDLTGAGRRFNARNMLEALIEPSKVISDQYEATMFVLDSGRQIVGRVVNLNNDRLLVNENMLDPGTLTSIKRDDIEEMLRSSTSLMPKALLNNLSKDEILDLIAYLQSGGDADADVFARK